MNDTVRDRIGSARHKPGAVASTLGVTVQTVYRLVARGELGCIRIGGRLRFSDEDVRAFVERATIRPGSQPAA
jgi:excisionase family DNA binding protein